MISGHAEALQPKRGRPVPHMGWNRVQHDGTGLFAGLENGAYFYFVHSFALPPSPVTVATSEYGPPLSAAGGNRQRAAEMLGISRATIYRKIRQHRLD